MRKSFGQEVHFHPEDIPIMSVINISLTQLWNEAVEQINAWLAMPSTVKVEEWSKRLGLEIHMGNSGKPPITPITLNFWLTDKRTNPLFSEVPITLQREMLRRLAGGFSSYFELLKKGDTKARPPGIKDIEKTFITLTWIKGAFTIEKNSLICSVGKRKTISLALGEYITEKLNSLPKNTEIVQVTISKREGKFWANFVCNIPRPEQLTAKGVMAIDLGSGNITFACSDGRQFSFPARRPDKHWKKRIDAVEKRTERCVKGSRAWKRRMGARRTMHNKSQAQHTDHQRKLARWIAEQGMMVVVGKMKTRLGLAQSSGTPEQHWGVQNTGYAMRLLIFLKEKAIEYGLTVLEFPDPQREGAIDDPSAKFVSAKKLLLKGCEHLKIPYPSDFKKEEFSFIQG